MAEERPGRGMKRRGKWHDSFISCRPLFSSSMHTYTRTQTHLVSPLPLTLDTGRRCAPGQDEKGHWQDG